MTYTMLEIIALVFVIAGLLKILIILVSRKSLANFAKNIYSKPVALMFIQLILAVVVFYYLFQELTMVQIMGGLVLGALLTGMSLAVLGKEVMNPIIKILKRGDVFKKAWLPILLWVAVMVWTLKEILNF